MSERGLLLPGYAARGAAYVRGLPPGWEALDPPGLRRTRGHVARFAELVEARVAAEPAPVALAGHSLGAALAVLAAARLPGRVSRLVLLAPAGLPLEHVTGRATLEFLLNVARGRLGHARLRASLADVLSAPRAALTLGTETRRLDLGRELDVVRASGIPCRVLAAAHDGVVPPARARALAERLGATCAIASRGDHLWCVTEPWRLRAALEPPLDAG